MSGSAAKEIWDRCGLTRDDLERIRVDAAMDELGYRRVLIESQDALREAFDRAFDEACATVVGPVIVTLVAWCGLLLLPDPTRCSTCGARMNDLMTWASDTPVGYVCPNEHDEMPT